MSSIKIDPAKLEELSAMLKKLSGTIGDREQYLFKDITQLTREIRGDYPEREVQRALDKVDADLQEIRKLASSVTSRLTKKSDVLIQAATIYRRDEEKAKKTMKQKYIPPVPSSYYIKGGGLSGEGLKAYLDDPLFQDPVVQRLHELALKGTEEEQTEAKKKLDEIFKARNTIARAQVAHAVYKTFGNIPLMNNAHKEAFNQREILKRYGISEDLYKEGVDLTALYKGSKLEACSYDPSFQIMKDDKFIPVLLPQDNQYHYLLGLIMEGGSKGAWAQKQLDEIHEQLKEIGRAQVAWWEYKAKNMKNEMNGAHEYAEKLRRILKEKYSLSPEMVDGVDFKYLWTGVGAAGKALNLEEKITITSENKLIDANALKEMNKAIKEIEGSKQKIIALYERNLQILPYITKDLTNKEVINSLEKFKSHYSKFKERYEKVSVKTGVPPELIAAIHWREGSGDFSTYLHNGDPLGKKTTHVPKGILFSNWEDAAIDAINMKKKVRDNVGLTSSSKDIPKMMAFAEFYNGIGYLNHSVNSVYVFSGTNIPLEGKYYSDGKFTYGPVKDSNPGVAIMLLSIMNVEGQGKTESTAPPVISNQPHLPNIKADNARDEILNLAKEFVGKVPYYLDEKRPTYLDPKSPPKGMDCSDFTSAVYRTVLRDLGVGDDIDIGINTATQIKSGMKIWGEDMGEKFNVSQLKKGDLILFTGANSSQVGHVALYLGDGKIIHESGQNNKKGSNVKISKLEGYWLTKQKPIAVRRIIGDDGTIYGQKEKKVGNIK
ncbi:C40 family peptidase [Paenibacillus sp. Marseille-P2973]|uniref:NlpC/P60 family protein n=1 Tax=Paenibacillus sp. Marseille-P2973 TaxID=1871032 RepID=UPI001B35D1AB|nr:NlpC/P60 family protein [Paenibacillus sp. Marseille-P2973]MBQ4900164.1 C40 family peptidase [Paenibacillus sp. Marseille-P2973]